MFGLPLAPEKHVPAGSSFVFLGVRTDFEGIPSTGTLTIGLTGERCDTIADAAEHALVAGRLSTADAARLTVRLAHLPPAAGLQAAGGWGRAPTCAPSPT
jgi:hypothetical protein